MSNSIAWKNIHWSLVQKRINKLQQRIYKSSKENNNVKMNPVKYIQVFQRDVLFTIRIIYRVLR